LSGPGRLLAQSPLALLSRDPERIRSGDQRMLADLGGFGGSLDVFDAFRTVSELLPKQSGSLVLGRNRPLGDPRATMRGPHQLPDR
jgi:hypothetical protein